MKKPIRKAVALAVLTMLLAGAVFAQTATVTDFSGKVEYRLAGGDWQAVRAGLTVPLNATISTGFSSTASLDVAGSTLRVAQLTRLTIEELADDGSTVSTGVFVPVGRVRATVTTPAERSSDFRLRTAQSTAAVRGTEFETNGWQIAVSEGVVEFANLLGQSTTVSATQISVVTEGRPTDPAEELDRQANIGDGFGTDESGDDSRTSGYITVRWGE